MSTFTVNSITYAIVASTQNVNVSACDPTISGPVIIPSSVTNPITTIQYTVIGINTAVFSGKTAITSFSLPDTLTSIGTSAFLNCTASMSLTLPNLTSIGTTVFQYCTGLTFVSFQNILFTYVGQNNFQGCSGLTSVLIPNLISTSTSAFSGCIGLTTVSFPNLTTIGASTFSGCTGLTSFNFTSNITTITSTAAF